MPLEQFCHPFAKHVGCNIFGNALFYPGILFAWRVFHARQHETPMGGWTEYGFWPWHRSFCFLATFTHWNRWNCLDGRFSYQCWSWIRDACFDHWIPGWFVDIAIDYCRGQSASFMTLHLTMTMLIIAVVSVVINGHVEDIPS